MTTSLKHVLKLLFPRYQKLILEYKVDMKPRYGHGKPPHGMLYEIINQHRDSYAILLKEFLKYETIFKEIPYDQPKTDSPEPHWNNGFFPGLDVVALYSLLVHFDSKQFIEIGSGNSTKVARKAIRENELSTKITSIDPYPRASIDHLADTVIRQPLETLESPQEVAEKLEANDILFIDNSHRCLPNSDATVCFLELLPYLKKGVVVHVHDVYLPYDYPQFMCDRFYSEQYTLAAFVLANPQRYHPLFPAYFVSQDAELSAVLNPLWQYPNTQNTERHGGSFWLQIQ